MEDAVPARGRSRGGHERLRICASIPAGLRRVSPLDLTWDGQQRLRSRESTGQRPGHLRGLPLPWQSGIIGPSEGSPLDLTRHLELLLATRSWPPSGPVAVAPSGVELVPFLKWAGGKRWLMPLACRLREMSIGAYIEPFLGSGAMYFGLQPSRAILSDSNYELIETYQAIADDWKLVLHHLRQHDKRHSSDYYYGVRNKQCRTPATRAARFIYLNRTCWNGLYRVNRAGIFNTPIGTKKRAVLDSDDFGRIAALLRNSTLIAGDFENQVNLAGSGDIVFADPPYTVRHQYNGFVKYNEQLFSWEDQERLHGALVRAKKRGAAIICTNADHYSIRELYENDFQIFALSRYSSIAGTGGTRGNYAEIVAIG